MGPADRAQQPGRRQVPQVEVAGAGARHEVRIFEGKVDDGVQRLLRGRATAVEAGEEAAGLRVPELDLQGGEGEGGSVGD